MRGREAGKTEAVKMQTALRRRLFNRIEKTNKAGLPENAGTPRLIFKS